MDCRTGEILDAERIRAKFGDDVPDHIKQMTVAPNARQLRTGKVGRNDPCPCGSGLKFKKCCMV